MSGRRALAAVGLAGALAGAARADSFVWDGELSQDWHSISGTTTNWDPDGLPGEFDTALIDGVHVNLSAVPVKIHALDVFSSLAIGRNLTIGSDAAISNLTINGGLLGGAGDISLFDQSVLNFGGFEGAANVTNHGTFTINVFTDLKGIGGSKFTNLGTVNSLDGLAFVNSTLINRGSYNLFNTGIQGLLDSKVENRGTITGSNSATVHMFLDNQGGTLAARMAGSTLSVSKGSSFTGGAIEVDQGGTVSLGGFDKHVIGGTLTASGAGNFALNSTVIEIDGEVRSSVTGPLGLHLQGGLVTGPGTIINEGIALLDGTRISTIGGLENRAFGVKALFINGSPTHAIATKLTNNGRIVHQGRQLKIEGGANVINEELGNYEIAKDAAVSIVGAGTFVNRGFLVKKGTQEAFITSILDLTGGTIDVQGGTLRLLGTGGGSTGGFFKVAQEANLFVNNYYDFQGDYQFEGDGTTHLASTVKFSNGDTTFNMPGGGVYFDDNTTISVIGGKVENKGKFRWTGIGGVINTAAQGRFVNAAGGTLELARRPFIGGTIENDGTVNQLDTASLTITGNSAFINRGQYNVSGGSIRMRDAGAHDFNNAAGGTFEQVGSSGFDVDVAFNNAGGTVELLGHGPGSIATLNLDGGGTHGAGAVFRSRSNSQLFLRRSHIGDGDVHFEGAGETPLLGTYTAIGTTILNHDGAGSFQLANPAAALTAHPGGKIDIQGGFKWLSGRMAGGSIAADGVVSGGVTNSGESFRIESTHVSGSILSGVLQNNGIVTHKRGALGFNGGTLINTGTYRFVALEDQEMKSVSAGGRFVNKGTLDVEALARATISVPFDFLSGRVEIEFSSFPLTFTAGGSSTGSGQYDVKGPMTFAGGVHSFTGDYTATGDQELRLSAGEIRGDFTANIRGSGEERREFVIAGGTLNGPSGQPVTNLGRVGFRGATVTGESGFINRGDMEIESGVVNKSSRIDNHQTVQITGGLDLDRGTFRNESGATTVLRGRITGAGGVIENEGEFSADLPAPTMILHRFNNANTLHAASGALTLQGVIDQYDTVNGSLTGGKWFIGSISQRPATLTLGTGQPLQSIKAGAFLRVTDGGHFINLPAGNIAGDFTNEGELHLERFHFRCSVYLQPAK